MKIRLCQSYDRFAFVATVVLYAMLDLFLCHQFKAPVTVILQTDHFEDFQSLLSVCSFLNNAMRTVNKIFTVLLKHPLSLIFNEKEEDTGEEHKQNPQS